MTRPAIILDTDPGIDDAFAIILALQHADLRAITTTAGNVGVDITTANALRILELAGGKVPVYRGAAGPLIGPTIDAGSIHGSSGLGGAELPDPSGSPEDTDAVSFLISATAKDPGLKVIAIGPLTNIALAIERDETFAHRLDGLTIMGGSAAQGNTTSAAEFNIYADPEAADIVFRAVSNIRMIGLNLTHQVKMGSEHVKAFAACNTRHGHVMSVMLEGYLKAVEFIGFDGVFMHDPTAVLAVTHPELIEYEYRHVSIETKGEHTRGMTVVDQRVFSPLEPNVYVGVNVDAQAIIDLVVASAL
jgi:inosine-uridine nucleoside N-ribohydrolase